MERVDLLRQLEAAGVEHDSIVSFEETASPRHVRYVDLLPMTNSGDSIRPDVVVESAGVPFLYVIRRDRLGDSRQLNTQLSELIRILACRADARFLAVVWPGCFDLYAIELVDGVPAPALSAMGDSAPGQLRGLLSGSVVPKAAVLKRARRAKTRSAHENWLEVLLFRLLSDAATAISSSSPDLDKSQVISLVGRALFFRYLTCNPPSVPRQ